VAAANADCDSRKDLRVYSVFREICRSEAVVERHGPTRFYEDNWHTYRHSVRSPVVAYNRGMTKPAEAVLAEALRLDVKARAEVAAELLASLDGPADADAEQAWEAEIERRVRALEAGTERLESWDDVKRRIEKDILGR
jgi:Putative addiction module component